MIVIAACGDGAVGTAHGPAASGSVVLPPTTTPSQPIAPPTMPDLSAQPTQTDQPGAGTGMDSGGVASMPIAGAGAAGDGAAADQGGAGAGASDPGSGGAGGSGGVAGPSTDVCAEPPAGASELAVRAWNVVNETRLAMGAGCMNLVPELIASAQGHCDYRIANAGNPSCIADSHGQVMGCTGFTGATVQDREVAAGYPRTLAYTEVYVTYGDPDPAVQSWIDTVYHRIPLLDPWTVDMGYGGASGCDVIDIGRGASTVPADTVVVYPYDGQTDVPPAWNGLEGPQPPAPPGGWPSAYPINIYAQDIRVSEHVLTRDGDSTPIEHLWLDQDSPEIGGLRSYFRNTAFLYGAPFELNTTYRVKIVGTYAGGALDVEWTFTTGSMRPWGT